MPQVPVGQHSLEKGHAEFAGAEIYYARVQRATELPAEQRPHDVQRFLDAHQLMTQAAAVMDAAAAHHDGAGGPGGGELIAAALALLCCSDGAYEEQQLPHLHPRLTHTKEILMPIVHPAADALLTPDGGLVPPGSAAWRAALDPGGAPLASPQLLASLFLLVRILTSQGGLAEAERLLDGISASLEHAMAGPALDASLADLGAYLAARPRPGAAWRLPSRAELRLFCLTRRHMVYAAADSLGMTLHPDMRARWAALARQCDVWTAQIAYELAGIAMMQGVADVSPAEAQAYVEEAYAAYARIKGVVAWNWERQVRTIHQQVAAVHPRLHAHLAASPAKWDAELMARTERAAEAGRCASAPVGLPCDSLGRICMAFNRRELWRGHGWEQRRSSSSGERSGRGRV
eukprot:scaffold2.g7359.t1